MILQSEILRIAEKEGVPPDTIDKNWVLGHFLAELFSNEWTKNKLVFKGGTCLKKCYFNDYRFSEDLDFTLTQKDFKITDAMIQSVCDAIFYKTGILFSDVKVDPCLWNNILVGYKSQIPFWGSNHKKNQQPTPYSRWQTKIKVEIICYEILVQNPLTCPLYSDYSDNILFNNVKIPCYTLPEIIAEKFRSLLQRSYPAPRDYYDLWHLLINKKLETLENIVQIFKKKIEYKQIAFLSYSDFFDIEQIKKIRKAWNNSLRNHLKENELPDFELILSELKMLCSNISWN